MDVADRHKAILRRAVRDATDSLKLMIDTTMKFLLFFGLLLVSRLSVAQQPVPIATGRQPSLTTDGDGTVHLVFGRPGEIWYSASQQETTFSAPVRVDTLSGLHLGASRGPQIAVSKQTVLITAIDGRGNVWAYCLDRPTGRWTRRIRVTDSPAAAPEGFVALTAAGEPNRFMAVWLDVRGDKQNKIAGAVTSDGGQTWSANRLLYRSPDGSVCECCQPSVAASGTQVAILFRNWLNGCRDMYVLKSTNGGQTFGDTVRLGQGSWPLKACPMDGGSLALLEDGTVETVWRRDNRLFAARPGELEVELGRGKNAQLLSQTGLNLYVWQDEGNIWALRGVGTEPKRLGPGNFAKLTPFGENQALCVWESEGKIVATVL